MLESRWGGSALPAFPAAIPGRSPMTSPPDQTDWQEFRRRLLAFVRRRVPASSDAEDIVQDILAKAVPALDRLRRSERLDAWLYRIARNAIADHYRLQGRQPPRADTLPEVPDDRPIDAPAGPPRDLADCLEPMLAAIPARYRDAVILADRDALGMATVAERLGLSVSGAKSRVQRGRLLLRGAFEHCCRLEHDARGHVRDFEPRPGYCEPLACGRSRQEP